MTIADDGRGGADPAAGSNFRGLSDRLAAIDGGLTISSPDGGGTTVRAERRWWRARARDGSRSGPAAESALARVRAVPDARSVQRRPGRVRWSSPAVLIAAVAASIAVMALIAAVPSMQPSPPDVGRADSFVRPFDYQVPAGSDIRLYPKSDHLHVLSAPPGDVQGISI